MKRVESILSFLLALAHLLFPRRKKRAACCPCPYPVPACSSPPATGSGGVAPAGPDKYYYDEPEGVS